MFTMKVVCLWDDVGDLEVSLELVSQLNRMLRNGRVTLGIPIEHVPKISMRGYDAPRLAESCLRKLREHMVVR